MRAGKLIGVAGLIWACVLGWAVLIPSLPDPSSVLHAAADDDDRSDRRGDGDRSDRRGDDDRGDRYDTGHT